MSKLNSTFAATAKTFNSGNPVRNGKMPLILVPTAGKFPGKRTVISGTIAKNEGFETGSNYLVKCSEGETSEQYGRQFVFNNIGKLSAIETLDVINKLGAAKPVEVVANVAVNEEVEA